MPSSKFQHQEEDSEFVQLPYEYEHNHWNFIQSTLTPLLNTHSVTKMLVLQIIGTIIANKNNKINTKAIDQFPNLLCLDHALDLFEEQYYPDDYQTEKSFVQTVMPFVASLVLNTEQFVPSKSLKYLKRGQTDTVEVSKAGAACLLANSFFCTWNRRSDEALWDIFPSINYDEMFCEHPNYR